MEYIFILFYFVFNSNDPNFIVVMLYLLGDGMVSSIDNDFNLYLVCITQSYFVVLVVGIFYLDFGS